MVHSRGGSRVKAKAVYVTTIARCTNCDKTAEGPTAGGWANVHAANNSHCVELVTTQKVSTAEPGITTVRKS